MKNKYKLPKEFAEKWIEALRSEKYKQGRGKLLQIVNSEEYYCCLGVAGKVCNIENEMLNNSSYLTGMKSSPEEFDDIFENSLSFQCMKLNDNLNKTFPEIADWVENNVEFY